MTMIKTIMKTVRTSATTMPITRLVTSLGAVSGTPVSATPPRTTLLHTGAITKPNAAPRELAIVLRTSDIERCFSSAIGTLTRHYCVSNQRCMFDDEHLDARATN